jgi:SAM-dependent methyltransferase
MSPLVVQGARVLDVGCGDGYLIQQLRDRFGFSRVVAEDPHLTEDLIGELSSSGIEFVRECPGDARFDLVLLLDVLEHTEPQSLLRKVADERLAPAGRLVITVPAFQQLFGRHDVALKHLRRYSLGELIEEVTEAGFEVLRSGYLFSSLLLPRALAVLAEKCLGASAPMHDVGEWKGGPLMSSVLDTLLTVDSSVGLAVNARGINVPGLTAWTICKTSS